MNIEYPKIPKGMIAVEDVFLGYAIDIIECPKEYFKTLTIENLSE